MSDSEIRRIVYGLEHAGLVEIVRASAPKASTPSQPADRKRLQQQPPQKQVVNRIIEKLRSLG